MNIISAYNQVGTLRAADLCGTTHKTVKRVLKAAAFPVTKTLDGFDLTRSASLRSR